MEEREREREREREKEREREENLESFLLNWGKEIVKGNKKIWTKKALYIFLINSGSKSAKAFG